MLKIFKVRGNSLYPFYKDGQRVLCFKAFNFYKIKKNDIVVFSKDHHGLMIKQVMYLENEKYFVQGTDPYSIDSRVFGSISSDEILYKVLFRV